MIDEARALKVAVDTGKVLLGASRAKRAAREKKARMVVVSSNCPDAELRSMAGVKIHVFPGTNAELGAACGKPFSVSAIAILDPGESNILQI
ncbi:MAG TPA: 50S ribosomal protein L30e [Thermoplasmata archaeon]|nr:50S ribosomal protein L30e [Thermoplasmata archaeon]